MKKSVLRKLVLILAFVLAVQNGYAQTRQFRQYTTEDGLPSNMIYEVKPDSKGFLWFCTDAGVSRFDGYEFTNYTTKDGLSDNEVFHTFEDSNGRIWFLTYNGKLSFYQDGKFFNPDNTNLLSNATSQDFINKVFEDRYGNIWFGGRSGTIIKVDSNLMVKTYTIPLQKSINGGYVFEFTTLQSGKLIVYCTRGSYYYDDQADQFVLINKYSHHLFSDAFGAKNRSHLKGRSQRMGELMIKNIQNTLVVMNHENQIVDFYQIKELGNEFLFISPAKDDLLWVGTGMGAFLVELSKPNPKVLYHALDGKKVTSVFEDLEANLWMGTLEDGAFVFPSANTQLFNADIPDLKITSLDIDDDQNIWIGHQSGHYEKMDGNWQFEYFDDVIDYYNYGNLKKRPSGSKIYKISPYDGSNRLISSTSIIYKSEVEHFIIRCQTEVIRHFDHIAKDSLVIASGHGLKFTRYSHLPDYGVDPLYAGFTHRVIPPDDFQIKTDAEISTLYYNAQAENLWIGTNNGLVIFDGKVFQKIADRINSRITDLTPLKSSLIAVATYGQGIFILDQNGEIVYEINNDNGLSDNLANSLATDESNRLWVATNNGLNCLSKTEGEMYYSNTIIDNYDGLPSNKINKVLVRDKEVWVGTNKGLSMTNVQEVKEKSRLPVYLKSLSVSGDNFQFSSEADLAFDHDNNDISISYSAITYSTGDKIEYRYKLISENEWVKTNNTSIEFSNLSPGTYLFEVQAKNKSGQWSKESAKLAFAISPPWWNTIWAYIAYTVSALIFAYGILQYELNRASIKSELQLQKLESGKYKEIERAKSLFFSNISHEIRTPLTLIAGPLEKILQTKDLKDIRKYTTLAQRNANSLLNLVNDLLDLSKIDAEKLELHLSHGNIIVDIEAVSQHFQVLAEKKEIDFFFESDIQHFSMDYDTKKLEMILNNLLSNAIKFTQAGGSIKIAVKIDDRSDQRFVIEVIDTGIGIPENKIDKLFDRFYQVDDSMTKEHEGTGIGLALTKKLVELHNGEIKVTSTAGRGSIFTVMLPTSQPITDEIAPPIALEAAESLTPKLEIGANNQESDFKVLVVDDNEELRNYITYILPKSYQIKTAINGKEGLSFAIDWLPDLIISDVMMPKMNGNELCQKLKENELTSHIPVILLTARSSTDAKIEAFSMGADQYLSKPFNHDELNARVAGLITQRQKLKEQFSSAVEFDTLSLANTDTDKHLLEKAVQAVEANMENVDFDVSAFGRTIGLSRTALHTKLKALTGQSTTQFIQSIRLRAAVNLMQSNNANISEISAKVGFNDPRYFARSFKKMFGKAPSEFFIE